jgi:hypothetical protein
MIRITLGFLLLFIYLTAFGQKTERASSQKIETSLHLNSGFFSFKGAVPTSTTYINHYDPYYYAENSYGLQSALSYGLAAQIQAITIKRFVYGIQAGWESLASQKKVVAIYRNPQMLPADGRVVYRRQFINFYPYFGYRVSLTKWELDFTGGMDVGIALGGHEKGEALLASSEKVFYDDRLIGRFTDNRIRVGVTAYYQRWGLSAGYSHGFYKYLNASNTIFGQDYDVTSRMIRLGMVYHLN